ncbi:tricarballylate utilization 4Fe-4S protein TcuB [Thiocystis violascens]|uniref:CitB domain protein n=1 Tax=Thiocystis violascens (strain ATCC 17096 / DSM 198 / 6111) TaxID=765911 RepID=I3Y9I5_THIV6|nr:tricarballylate utilization 4Fe-4S protein TcuB [Thiocystis violascens]AFL73653.1 CitB domain protein [Thiocystis violascens DSM 198]
MPVDESLAEARRVLEICNVCGYCNGFCDLFESAKRRPALTDTDLAHLANLCHGCRNCLYACQYAPPHVFAVNVPRALARTRQRNYAEYAWPRAWSGLLAQEPRIALLVTGGAIGLLLGMVLIGAPPETLFAVHTGAGAFYRILPWWVMVLIGVLPLGWSLLAIGTGLRRYWRATRAPDPITAPVLWSAVRDVLTLRNHRGGGPGCNDLDDRPSHWRRWLHQTLLLGLLLCLAATLIAGLYHHFLNWPAPYPWFSLPVVFGTLGGIAMTIAALGLAWLQRREDRTPTDPDARAADRAFLAQLFLVAATGLALLAWRATPAMGLLLAVHLGSVLAFFLLLPYGKFVHAGYRFLALVNEAMERRSGDARGP